MRELSLFTGAGGGLLGTHHLLGWEAVGYVEWDDHCQRVIAQRIADGLLPKAPIFGDIRAFISDGYTASYQGMVDVVTGGFPCQPFSVAGKQQGADDPRNMWPQTIATIRAVRPRFAFLENVPGLISAGYLATILGDLAESGYDARWCVLGARHVGSPTQRDRLWIKCWDSKCMDVERLRFHTGTAFQNKFWGTATSADLEYDYKNWEISHGELCGMGYGMVQGMESIKALGNSQVPAVVAKAWEILTMNNDQLSTKF